MKLVMIGSGSVAHHLGSGFQQTSHSVVQVYSRSEVSAIRLARKLKCDFTTEASSIYTKADVYILALRDSAISDFLKKIPATKKLILHTSGSVSINVFKKKFSNYGVMYPLQSFSIGRKVKIEDVPFCLEGSNKEVLKKTKLLVQSVSKNIHTIDSKHRQYLHLAAVFANNFSNHLYTVSEDILKKHNLPFSLLRPLILETAKKVQNNLPQSMQTGPAKRKDTETLSTHLALLKSRPLQHQIYKLLSKSIEHLNDTKS